LHPKSAALAHGHYIYTAEKILPDLGERIPLLHNPSFVTTSTK